MTDNKERLLVFAHVGTAFIPTYCDKIGVARAFGTILPCGMHLTHFQMDSKYAKRASALGHVVAEYNRIVPEHNQIVNITRYPECEEDGFVCLKPRDALHHPIIKKISMDLNVRVAAAWSVPGGASSVFFVGAGGKITSVIGDAVVLKKAKTPTGTGVVQVVADSPAAKAKKESEVSENMIKKILQSLEIDARHVSSLKLRSVVNDISDQIFEEYGPILKFSKVHHDFVLEKVKVAFKSELVYGVAPPKPGKGEFPEALWDVSGGQAVKYNGKMLVESKEQLVKQAIGVPNQMTLDFFSLNLDKWSGMLMEDGETPVEVVNFTVKQFLFFMNGGHPTGVYTSSCVRAFLSAFIGAGTVVRNTASGRGRGQAYTVRLAELRVFLKK